MRGGEVLERGEAEHGSDLALEDDREDDDAPRERLEERGADRHRVARDTRDQDAPAVQRALADFGYGQINPSGVLDPPTQAAIQRFERDRKLPITGKISDRLTRELTVLSGRPLE